MIHLSDNSGKVEFQQLNGHLNFNKTSNKQTNYLKISFKLKKKEKTLLKKKKKKCLFC